MADKADSELREFNVRGLSSRGLGKPPEAATSFHNDEAAARYWIDQVFAGDERSSVRGLRAPEHPRRMPDFKVQGIQELPITQTRMVRFQQTREQIPIFGSRMVVEMDQNRELVTLSGEVAQVKGASPIPSVSPEDALSKIAEFVGVEHSNLSEVNWPHLVYRHDSEGDDLWHLAWFFEDVPAAPMDFFDQVTEGGHGHPRGPSPRVHEPLLNYLVDAHDGKILFYYSAGPTLDIPTKMRGMGELDRSDEFWGRHVAPHFEMLDPIRRISTYDHTGNDIRQALPSDPIRHGGSDLQTSNRAAVSAHANATRVFDFFKSVLLRDGVDDKGMDLVSIINCTYKQHQQPPEWHNAIWWKNRMWYGQDKDGSGKLRSYSRFLDVIAHELTHGITEYTSDLVYQGQSGALNESFSDIFGVIVKNWYEKSEDDPTTWDWEMGAGLGDGGLPLRDMSDPTRTKDPDHMNKYVRTNRDNGGVHTNSNIHNKAAYKVLTATDETGQRVFAPREVAILYYLCLSRLNQLATFADTLEALVEVATVYYAGNPVERDLKIKSIRGAYAAVGIQ